MAIVLSDAVTLPQVTYDRVFLVSMDIRQEHRDTEGEAPLYLVVIKYRLYGVSDDGTRYYDGKGIRTVRYEDFMRVAQQKSAEGDSSYLEAFAALQEAIGQVVASDQGTTATVI